MNDKNWNTGALLPETIYGKELVKPLLEFTETRAEWMPPVAAAPQQVPGRSFPLLPPRAAGPRPVRLLVTGQVPLYQQSHAGPGLGGRELAASDAGSPCPQAAEHRLWFLSSADHQTSAQAAGCCGLNAVTSVPSSPPALPLHGPCPR